MSAVLKEQGDFADSSGHWYGLDGTPRYTIIGANGKERNTTVRDAKKLGGLVPSVTTVLKQAAAPGLVKWMKEQVAKAAYRNGPKAGESEEEYAARMLPLSEEVARTARKTGEVIHGAIEKLDRHGPYALHVDAAMGAVSEWAGIMDWDAERSFASPLGFGGKLDLSAPGYVIDFKSTDKPLDDLKTWPDHRRQLAAYRHGLGMPEARCAICFVSSKEVDPLLLALGKPLPKLARLIELDKEELEQGWSEFRALLSFYYASNKLKLPEAA